MLIPILASIVAGYFLGALPFGYVVSRAKGVNIFEEGSKNPGATNVLRVLSQKFGEPGRRLGIMVFVLDALKGAVATGWPWIAFKMGVWDAAYDHWDVVSLIGLGAALLGHCFSCFTRFKGGKGVATGAGGFMVLMAPSLLIALLVWWVVFQTTRYVSLASILATVSLPVSSCTMWCLWGWPPFSVVIISAGAAIFVAVRHRANIGRLMRGTENKFVKKTPEEKM
ncbi:glycerol-3-phosphate acyltransferase PlsY [Ereboglobus sp. PH5-5]|uniref:glycerol-3-phosphate 1-O-acyltransferase PlsY n=1 Tax=unclassified Ereboglobus TaxID=2626932 RepID=UPI00240703B0|nr:MULTISPECIES: glycerol-3-phosphate 1-O-acyltransferase PlsY [unclassified Ereboglobus]MDF9828411.1 glycerol-3-phosphate acyltransferase PlsY [Ereboglobus sp. PH5-10]MDF9834293.1 glycerol-3-phosphate acyltransferase PlsY [Ereboglobus sp. PH5-5]